MALRGAEHMELRGAGALSEKYADLIAELKRDGTIVAVEETGRENSAFYKAEDKKIYVSRAAKVNSIHHEFVHYFQDRLGMMKGKIESDPNANPPFVSCATDNEYQAEFFVATLDILKSPQPTYDPRLGWSETEFANFSANIRQRANVKNGTIISVREVLLGYMEDRFSKYADKWVNFYSDYNKANPKYKDKPTYTQGHDPQYMWRWIEIFEAFGITIN